jgi:hypothetical protein
MSEPPIIWVSQKIILSVSAQAPADWDSHIPLLHPDDREETR